MPDMNPPEQITPTKLGDYLDVMSKAVFQSGISWRVVESKWAGTREVFRDFDPQTLTDLSPDEVDAMATDTRIIRNRRKVEAIITNARRMLELADEHGSFQAYLRSHPDFETLHKDLRKNFKFLRDMGVYYMLYLVGEQVPDHTEYMASRK
ncbi:MAG: DNA-3-methyladenine glycosylase I [Chloroflexi bacterium]|nr:DNA-3-methyladenine glycosylase I [Chloroflexota bacterium]MDA1175378.1 DNA-3-methyladenine glycosylase I [Chloroflexota bacterium]